MSYYTETYPHLLPEIYFTFKGKPMEIIDLSQDIPKLMEYIQAFDNGTAETIKMGEPTLEYGYYWDQLDSFIQLHPNFDTCMIPNQQLQQVLSGLYSNKKILKNDENYLYM
jgi:hypothetical protein